jgi:hypothetical protein
MIFFSLAIISDSIIFLKIIIVGEQQRTGHFVAIRSSRRAKSATAATIRKTATRAAATLASSPSTTGTTTLLPGCAADAPTRSAGRASARAF